MAKELIQEIPKGAREVQMQAFSPLDDPYSGHVEAGEEFTTTDTQEKFYAKANWAGPVGVSAREIQVSVAAEELAERKDAKKFARHARQTARGLFPNSAARGNVAAVDVIPAIVGEVEESTEQRTNQQVAKTDVAGNSLADTKIATAGNEAAQKLQDEAEKEHSSSSSNEGDEVVDSTEQESRGTEYASRSRGQNLADAKERGLNVKENESNVNLAKALREDDESRNA